MTGIENQNRVNRFDEYLGKKGKSKHTREEYKGLAKRFLAQLNGPLNRDAVTNYIQDLKNKHYADNTIRWTVSVLKELFKSEGVAWEIPDEEIPPKEHRRQPAFTDAQMQTLIETARLKGKKEHALLRIACCTGLRRSELANLNISDFQPPHIHYRTKRPETEGLVGARQRLDSHTCEAVQTWIEELQKEPKRKDMEALFIRGKRGPRMVPDSLSSIVNLIQKKAGLDTPDSGLAAIRRGRAQSYIQHGLHEFDLYTLMGLVYPKGGYPTIKEGPHQD